MKQIIYSLTLILVLMNCSASNSAQNNSVIFNNEKCNENLDFKKEYFFHMGIIDSLVSKSQNKEFKKSLGFISKYSHVSFEDTANYFNHYPIPTYDKDRKGWLEWYEKNKYNNIQFKK